MIFALRTSLARNLGDMGNPKVHNPMFVYVRFSYLFGKHIALLIFTCRHKRLDLWIHWRSRETIKLDMRWACRSRRWSQSGFESKAWFLYEYKTKLWTHSIATERWRYIRYVISVFHVWTYDITIIWNCIGLNHIGVIKCLHEAQLLPRIISGASSGSIMASLVCTKTNDELPSIFDPSLVRLVSFLQERLLQSTNTCKIGCVCERRRAWYSPCPSSSSDDEKPAVWRRDPQRSNASQFGWHDISGGIQQNSLHFEHYCKLVHFIRHASTVELYNGTWCGMYQSY